MTRPSRLLLSFSAIAVLLLADSCAALSLGAKRPHVARQAPPLQYANGAEFQAKFIASAPVAPPPAQAVGWRGRLLKASNFASILCVLDCTVLPVVTLVLPLFGFMATSPTQMEFLHELGHTVALFFVLPVGGSATLLNYMYAHRKKRIAALGMLGLLLVLAANAPHSLLHALEHGILAPLEPLLHAVHHGIAHRLVNLLGCALLLTGNYLGKVGGNCALVGCFCGPRRQVPNSLPVITNFVTHAHVNGDRFNQQIMVLSRNNGIQKME